MAMMRPTFEGLSHESDPDWLFNSRLRILHTLTLNDNGELPRSRRQQDAKAKETYH